MVRRWRVLQALQDRNETLFYKVIINHIVEMAPIIYTPTVGWVCMNYHTLYQKPRGLYISAKDKGEIASVVWNWPANEVDAIVVTDGSRILGLGDLGLNGMGALHVTSSLHVLLMPRSIRPDIITFKLQMLQEIYIASRAYIPVNIIPSSLYPSHTPLIHKSTSETTAKFYFRKRMC
jgi:hypothetical protein